MNLPERGSKMPQNSDIGEMYNRARRRSYNKSVYDAQKEINADHYDSRYYMCMPHDYIIKRGIRLMLAFMVCVLACHSLLTIVTPPLFLIVFLKWKSYCRICSSMNISSRKLNLLLGGWFFVCIFVNIAFWNRLTQLL